MSLPPQEQIPQQLATAKTDWSKLRRLAGYASFDGWSVAIVGSSTLICGGYGSVMGLVISIALIGTGVFEISSVRQLRRLNPSAIMHLTYNQLALACVLILYSIVSMTQSHNSGPSGELQQAFAQAGVDARDFNDVASTATQILYTSLIGCAVLIQGGTALYYFSRQKYLRNYLQQTPDWIQQMQRDRGEVSI